MHNWQSNIKSTTTAAPVSLAKSVDLHSALTYMVHKNYEIHFIPVAQKSQEWWVVCAYDNITEPCNFKKHFWAVV